MRRSHQSSSTTSLLLAVKPKRLSKDTLEHHTTQWSPHQSHCLIDCHPGHLYNLELEHVHGINLAGPRGVGGWNMAYPSRSRWARSPIGHSLHRRSAWLAGMYLKQTQATDQVAAFVFAQCGAGELFSTRARFDLPARSAKTQGQHASVNHGFPRDELLAHVMALLHHTRSNELLR